MVREHLDSNTRDGQKRVLTIYVYESPIFNAEAGAFDEGDAIALSSSVLPVVLTISRAIASRYNVAPTICERPWNLVAFCCPIPARTLITGAHLWRLDELPDAGRESIAKALCQLCLTMILRHELAHILNGHCDFIGRGGRLSMIQEAEDVAPKLEGDYTRETLEWDADSAAVAVVLEAALRPIVTVVDSRAAWELPSTGAFGSARDGLSMAIMALVICSLILSANETGDALDPKPRKHPHPLFRSHSLISLVAHTISYRTGAPFEQAVNEAVGLSISSLADWMHVFPHEYGEMPLALTDMTLAAYAARARVWQKTWTDLHPVLDSLKRTGRLAPPEQALHPAFPENPTYG